jgi:ubiquinone/menaquinone biosynthesis C-methylase UbiE
MTDAAEYRKESRTRWGAAAKGWAAQADAMGRTTMPVSLWMVEALGLQAGHDVLELAAGTGEVGFLAAEQIAPTGTLISSDFAPEMITVAQARAEKLGITNVRFRQIDAESIDQPAATLDGVLCRWGYMLMADPRAALRETGRVLRPGGRVALSVWGDPRANLWASVPAAVLSEHTGQPPPDPLAPGIFAMASEERTRELLTEARLTPRRMEHVEMEWSFDTPDDHWRYVMDLAGALAMRVRSLPEDDQAAVRRLTEERLRPMARTPGYGLGGVCLNVLAE